jgi:hypothetical protein
MEKKSYEAPKVVEIGALNEAVHADQISFDPDGVVIKGDRVLILLTKTT